MNGLMRRHCANLLEFRKFAFRIVTASIRFGLIIMGWFAISDHLMKLVEGCWRDLMSSWLWNGLGILVAAAYSLFPPYTNPREEDIRAENFGDSRLRRLSKPSNEGQEQDQFNSLRPRR